MSLPILIDSKLFRPYGVYPEIGVTYVDRSLAYISVFAARFRRNLFR